MSGKCRATRECRVFKQGSEFYIQVIKLRMRVMLRILVSFESISLSSYSFH